MTLRSYAITCSILLGLISCSLYLPSFAHTTGGTHEVTVDDYFIDIGYEPEFPTTAAPTRFDFSLFSATTTIDVPYSDVWVTIAQNETLLFSGSISNPRIGPTGFSLLLTTPGAHTVTARFLDDTTIVAETTFTLPVIASDDSAAVGWVWWLVVAGTLAVLVATLVGWRWRTSETVRTRHTSG
jgi:hypothetical protein